MKPDETYLLKKLELTIPLIGFYDAPDANQFAPLTQIKTSGHVCVFAFYKKWLNGETLHMTKENFGCGGAGLHLFNVESRSRDDFIKFLADDEGLRATHELMGEWVDQYKGYGREYPNILIGPLREDQYEYLKSVTFLVNPDQLGLLILGAHYYRNISDPMPVLAPFGSGCMQLIALFKDLSVPQAIISATDIAMRQYLPPDILGFTVTKPLFEELCKLDSNSFLEKPFWQRLQKTRAAMRNG